jgi:DNA-binding NarL/FixJ family response regulator
MLSDSNRAKSCSVCSQRYGESGIADQMNVSQRTIESHVSNMLGKTGLHNRTELARWAIESSMA